MSKQWRLLPTCARILSLFHVDSALAPLQIAIKAETPIADDALEGLEVHSRVLPFLDIVPECLVAEITLKS